MAVKIKIGPTVSTILRANFALLKELSSICSYQKLNERQMMYSEACKNGWDGRVSVLNKLDGTFPSGLAPRVIRWLKENGHEVEIEKELPRTEVHPKMAHLVPLASLRPYQKEAVAAAVKYKRGIIQAPTRSGKTEMAVGITLELKRPTIFFVHTQELLKQAVERFEKYLPDVKVGWIGEIKGRKKEGKINPGLITIAMVPTVSGWLIPPKEPVEPKQKPNEFWDDFSKRVESYQKRKAEYNEKYEEWSALHERAKKFLAKFNVAIFDECHHLAADTFFECAKYCTGAEYLYALSATAFRDDGADLLIEAGSGDRIFALTISDVVDMGFLLPADVHIIDYPDLPEMDLGSKYDEQYELGIVQNDGRNDAILEQAVKFGIDQKLQVLVLCRVIHHIDKLSEMLTAQGVPHATTHGKKKDRDQVFEDFKSGKIQILIASGIFDEGVDCPGLDVVIMAGGGKSSVKAYQRLGRSLTPHESKIRAVVVDFRDTIKPFCYHFRERMKIYKSERALTVIENKRPRKERQVVNKYFKTGKRLEEFALD